jgi:perosamine synthetase
MFRRQLPAYSPLTEAGLFAGIRGARSRPRERLADLLADRYRARRVVLTGSGTQALTLALRASAPAGRQPLVALPAYACYDVVSGAVGADARIAFYDVDPLTLAPDSESLAEACVLEPDAVVVAPLYGVPVAWEAVRRVVKSCGALLVEDAAQGLGAAWHGEPVGSLGDVSILSFGRGKGWTGGTGGALLERTAEPQAALPRATGRSDVDVATRAVAQWLLGRPRAYWLPARLPWLALGETEYHPPREPQSMPELAAALVVAHDPEALRESDTRRRNAAEILELLAAPEASDIFKPVRAPAGGEAGYLRLPVLVATGMDGFPDPDKARSRGVMPGYPRALPDLPAASERCVAGRPTPGATRLVSELITLPTHGLLTPSDRSSVRDVLASYVPRMANHTRNGPGPDKGD